MLSCQFDWWKDHDYNDIQGTRITTNVECGSILLTMLTFAVSLAEIAVWTLVAYTLFQILASKHEFEAFRAQIQLVLLNPTGPFSDWWGLTRTGWNWRKHRAKAAIVLMSVGLVPFSLFIGFSAAHILVARVTLPGYEANKYPILGYTNGLTCGIPAPHNPNAPTQYFEAEVVWASHILNNTRVAQNYKNQCYHKAFDPLACGGFVQQELKYKTPQMVPCPWTESNLCYTPKAYQMDTDFIDSHRNLGINARSSDRIQIRKVTTCSVIDTTNFRVLERDPESNGRVDEWEFYFGLPFNASPYTNKTHNGANQTFRYTRLVSNSIVPYIVIPVAFPHVGSDSTGVIADLYRSDGDLTLIGLAAGGIQYLGQNTDPFFSANRPDTDATSGIPMYWSDVPMQVMGCLDQIQFRNPVNGVASLLTNPYDAYLSVNSLGINAAQNATAWRLYVANMDSSTYWNIAGLGASALAANLGVWGGYSVALPNNQWQIEIVNWFDTGLAKLQRSMIEYVTNTWTQYDMANQYMYRLDPNTAPEEEKATFLRQCTNQLISGVALRQTFSALGVIIIMVLSPLLILCSLLIGRTVRRFGTAHARSADLGYRKQNVLRMALESRGYDGWIFTHQEIPIREHDRADIPPPKLRNDHVDIPSAPHILSPHSSRTMWQGRSTPSYKYESLSTTVEEI